MLTLMQILFFYLPDILFSCIRHVSIIKKIRITQFGQAQITRLSSNNWVPTLLMGGSEFYTPMGDCFSLACENLPNSFTISIRTAEALVWTIYWISINAHSNRVWTWGFQRKTFQRQEVHLSAFKAFKWYSCTISHVCAHRSTNAYFSTMNRIGPYSHLTGSIPPYTKMYVAAVIRLRVPPKRPLNSPLNGIYFVSSVQHTHQTWYFIKVYAHLIVILKGHSILTIFNVVMAKDIISHLWLTF